MLTKSVRKAVVLIAALLLSLAFAPASHAALSAVGPVDPVTTFPSFYQDATGLSLGPCFDNNGLCSTTMTAALGFDPASPVVFPTNFPEEGFYFVALADAGSVSWEGALELAFANGPVAAGDQLVFARIRIRDRLAADGSYTITHPYGQDVLDATAGGGLNFTEDIGIAPQVFTGALEGRVGPFLRKSTGLVTAAGGVYVGDSITPVAVEATPGLNATSVTVAGPVNATTSLFVLEGKVIGMSVTPTSITFPAQRPAINSAPVPVTVTNLDQANALTIATITPAGANAVDFQIADVNCLTAPVAGAGNCTFNVIFNGGAAGPVARTATVTISATLASVPKSFVQPVTGIIDAVPPSIIASFPTSSTAPANVNVTLTFSESMLASSITSTTFTLLSNGVLISGTTPVYSDANKTASIALPAAQETALIGTVITAQTTTGMTDLVGNPLSTAVTFTFTATEPDRVKPDIASIDPANNAIGIPTSSVIKVTFSEAMLSTSITNSVVQVTAGGVAVEGTVTVSGSEATFTPSKPLAFGTPYTLTITTGAQDLASNALATAQTINFITNFQPTAPVIVSPENGATGVAAPVVLRWTPSTDQDLDTVQYHLFLCNNQAFVGSGANCILNKNVTPTTAAAKGVYFASVLSGGMLFSLFGLGFAAGLKGRKKVLMMIAVLAVSSLFIVSCSSNNDDNPAPAPASTELTTTVEGLAKNVTFFWKIEADDGKGGVIATPVRSFTTAP